MSGDSSKISVVIPTTGRARPLEASLSAFDGLESATPDFEVVVVLDGEDSETRQNKGAIKVPGTGVMMLSRLAPNSPPLRA